ncbi:MAG: CpsD/CapB family tyrosine-protein kinase [Rhodospirillales bacterium]|nr:CpsD/CapB family tyrosine-protein kinase [Alphaproteobacteria bacterium]MCB9981415.1 CpsD/CapB family tyrosine-protein kinase [Rhodospirillales bacterium]
MSFALKKMQEKIEKIEESPNLTVKKALALLRLDTASLKDEKAGLSAFETVLDYNRIVSHRTRSKDADIFRFLRTQILQSMNEHGFKTVAISSPRYGDGKTTIAANLAVSIAQDLKQTVLLVDLDLRKPSLAEYLELSPKAGLTDYLAGKADVKDCLIRMPFERINVFPAGRPVDRSSETLGSPQMQKLAAELKERYDDRLIIYDMPPLLEQDDPLVFLPHVDAFLLVIREGVTTVDEIKRSLDILKSAKVIGVVLNAV